MTRKLAFLAVTMVLVGLATLGARAEGQPVPTASPAAAPKSGFTPEWARHAVWYQIFPERFRNSDPKNDPRLEDQKGSWPHDQTLPWQIHPWTSDWYELQPYEKQNGKDIWFNLQRRRYGGDLQGVIDSLDYLKGLGVNALYLNPVFASPSSHKYDAYVYHHIDPNFGPDPDGDRKMMALETPEDPKTWKWTSADRLALRLIQEAHKRGMRVIFDGVFNHIGKTSPFFQDVVKNQQRSRFKDWFVIKSWDDPARGTKFAYEGWFGVPELPNWRQDDNGTVAGPKDYIFAITRRWMDPSGQGRPQEGLDGWRLDVAFCVKHPFWKDWSRLVRSLNPQAYMTAEVIDTPEANKPFLEGDEFSAVMNYNFAFASTEFFFANRTRITPTQFDQRLRLLREAYPAEVAYCMQNLLDSHDTARLASNIINSDVVAYRDWPQYCEKAKATNPAWSTAAPSAGDKRRQKLAAIFQMTYVGAPMLYYGDETGMWGADDPCCRKPMIWEHLQYGDEALLPDQKPRAKADKVAADLDLLAHYRTCIRIRNQHPALRVGDFKTLLTDDAGSWYAFSRSTAAETVVVVLNNGDAAGTARIKTGPGTWKDELGGKQTWVADREGFITVPVDARWGAVLVRSR